MQMCWAPVNWKCSIFTQPFYLKFTYHPTFTCPAVVSRWLPLIFCDLFYAGDILLNKVGKTEFKVCLFCSLLWPQLLNLFNRTVTTMSMATISLGRSYLLLSVWGGSRSIELVVAAASESSQPNNELHLKWKLVRVTDKSLVVLNP